MVNFLLRKEILNGQEEIPPKKEILNGQEEIPPNQIQSDKGNASYITFGDVPTGRVPFTFSGDGRIGL